MNKKFFALSAGVALLGMAGMAQATLTTIGTATYNGADYKLIWDDDNNGNSVVWLDYTNPDQTFSVQQDWAYNLDGQLDYHIDSGYNLVWNEAAWRLPEYFTTSSSSEMDHLFYDELGNQEVSAYGSTADGGLKNTGDFDNLFVENYWLYRANLEPLSFAMNTGRTGIGSGPYSAIAIRNAQVSPAAPVPEPATMLLFTTGLVALAGCKRKRKEKVL